MAWLLFVDESGTDGRNSPYEVLAGLAIEDRQLWPLIRQLNDLQTHCFGLRLFSAYGKEAKAQKLLKRKVFRLADQMPAMPNSERQPLARAALEDGASPSKAKLTALAQAKLVYCARSLEMCQAFGAVAFASIVPARATRPEGSHLRKDYAFLFERYYHFLNGQTGNPVGLVIFDELEKVQCQRLIGQMDDYFIKTGNGRTRSRLIVPEPLFVHSDLTTMIQMTDIIAYVISWAVRFRNMTEPRREELDGLAKAVMKMQYIGNAGPVHRTRGFKLIPSLHAAAVPALV